MGLRHSIVSGSGLRVCSQVCLRPHSLICALICALALLSACSNVPPEITPGPAQVPQSALDTRVASSTPRSTPGSTLSLDQWLRSVFATARKLVESHSGTSLDGLSLHVVSDARIDVEVREETRSLALAQFNSPNYANYFVERVMQAQSGTYLALYSARHNAIFTSRRLLERFVAGIDDTTIAHEAVLALLIHEAVHAADDRRHNINAVRTLDFRAAFAQSAVYEGHAQWQTRQLCALAACVEGLQRLDRFMFGDARANQALQPSTAVSRNVIEYAYIEGERFIGSLATRQRGPQLLEQLLGDPPVDPIQILDPDSWPNNARERRNHSLVAALADLQHHWNSTGFRHVQTSPLKGVNLRADPARRAAAVDGFTRLLTAMAAVEIHDTRDKHKPPVEVTLLEGITAETASLFARTLQSNNVSRRAVSAESVDEAGATRLLRTTRTIKRGRAHSRINTLVAFNGRYVLQLVAVDSDSSLLDDYASKALDSLTKPAGSLIKSAASTNLR